MSWTDPAGVVPNVNPNEPGYPYGGGSDNPGDNTALPGHPTGVQSVETAPLAPTPHVTGVVNLEGIHPGINPAIAAQGTDTVLPAGMQAVPPNNTTTPFESSVDRGADPEGGVQFDPISGETREAGQDETQGETETSPGTSPAAFPEPNP